MDVKKGTSKEKLYKELGLEILEKRRWYWKLCCSFKIFRYQYPFNITSTSVITYNQRNTNIIPLFKLKHNFFFLPVVIEWNKLDQNIRDSENVNILTKTNLKFIRPSRSTVYNCHNPKMVKSLTRLRLGLSHLLEHNFKHSFQDSLNPIFSCGKDMETPAHFLLHCPDDSNERPSFLNIRESINWNNLTHFMPLISFDTP